MAENAAGAERAAGAELDYRGTGHPNEVMLVDYALRPVRRTFRAETEIDLTGDANEAAYNRLVELLSTPKPREDRVRAEIVSLLSGQVDMTGTTRQDKDQAKKMFAAAFGF